MRRYYNAIATLLQSGGGNDQVAASSGVSRSFIQSTRAAGDGYNRPGWISLTRSIELIGRRFGALSDERRGDRGGTIAPIDDVRLTDQRLLGPVCRGDHRSLSRSRSARLAHPRRCPPSCPLWRHAAFALDAADPAAELERLAKLREQWLSQRDRLTLVPLEIGNVDDYAATLKQVSQSHPIDVVFLPMAVADFEPEPRARENQLRSRIARPLLPAARPR